MPWLSAIEQTKKLSSYVTLQQAGIASEDVETLVFRDSQVVLTKILNGDFRKRFLMF